MPFFVPKKIQPVFIINKITMNTIASDRKYCHNCGEALVLNARFCSECGTKIIEQSSSSEAHDNLNEKTEGQITVKIEDFEFVQQFYAELEKKLSLQGKELNELKEFVRNISPLLDKLDTQPEVIQAIIDGKFETTFAKAALEGKLKIED